MPAGLGLSGYLSLAPESSGGVAVTTPAAYIAALSESLSLEWDRYELANMVGRLAEPDDAAGVKRVTGETIYAADPDTLGFFLAAALGYPRTVTQVSGSLYTHIFQAGSMTCWDDRFAQQPFTVAVHRDVGQEQVYAGCVLSRLALSVTPNDAIRCQGQWLGLGYLDTRTPQVASFTAAAPFAFSQASISIDGTGTALVEAFGLSIERPLAEVSVLAAKHQIHKLVLDDHLKVRLQLNLGFETITELQAYANQTERAFRLSIAGGSLSQLVIDVPRAVYTTYPTGMGARGRQTVQVDARARFHAGSGTAISVTLQGPRGFYVFPPPLFSIVAS